MGRDRFSCRAWPCCAGDVRSWPNRCRSGCRCRLPRSRRPTLLAGVVARGVAPIAAVLGDAVQDRSHQGALTWCSISTARWAALRVVVPAELTSTVESTRWESTRESVTGSTGGESMSTTSAWLARLRSRSAVRLEESSSAGFGGSGPEARISRRSRPGTGWSALLSAHVAQQDRGEADGVVEPEERVEPGAAKVAADGDRPQAGAGKGDGQVREGGGLALLGAGAGDLDDPHLAGRCPGTGWRCAGSGTPRPPARSGR